MAMVRERWHLPWDWWQLRKKTPSLGLLSSSQHLCHPLHCVGSLDWGSPHLKRNNKWNNTILFSFSVPWGVVYKTVVSARAFSQTLCFWLILLPPPHLSNMHTPSSSSFSPLIYFPSTYVLPPLPLQGNLPSYSFPVAASTETPHQTSRTTKFKLDSTYEREDKTFVCGPGLHHSV